MKYTEATYMDDDFHTGMIQATGTYYPGEPGKMYLANGDPGYPPEPPEIEVNSIEWIPFDEKTEKYMKEKAVDVSELLFEKATIYYLKIEQELFERGGSQAADEASKAEDDYYDNNAKIGY